VALFQKHFIWGLSIVIYFKNTFK